MYIYAEVHVRVADRKASLNETAVRKAGQAEVPAGETEQAVRELTEKLREQVVSGLVASVMDGDLGRSEN